MKLELYGLTLPEIKPYSNLAQLIMESAVSSCGGLKQGDILVVTSKIISKAKGLLANLNEIKPSPTAQRIARKTGLNPRYLEVVLRESDALLFVLPLAVLVEKGILQPEKLGLDGAKVQTLIKKYPYEIFVRRKNDLYSSAGVDSSNHPEDQVSIPPENHDEAAAELRKELFANTGIDIPVVISDTEYTLALGTMDIARGLSGLKPVAHKFGYPDRFGKPKFGGADCIAHELASAAALLMGQTNEGVPVVLIRGFKYEVEEKGIKDYSLNPKAMGQILKLIVKHSVKVMGIYWLGRLLRIR